MARANLTPKQLAQAVGVSESSMKRWIDEGRVRAHRTEGGHRRVPLEEAIRFVRESDLTLVVPTALGLPDPGTVLHGVSTDETTVLLHRHLSAGRADRARAVILGLYASGKSVADICDGPMRGAMRAIGDLWPDRDDAILIEHRATEICVAALHQLRAILPAARNDWSAVGGAFVGDAFLLPSLSVATALHAEGIRAINLGPNVPAEVLLAGARDHDARLVWWSASAGARPAELSRAMGSVARSCREQKRAFVAGGQQVDELPATMDLREVTRVRSLRDLVSFARGLLVVSSPPTGPAELPSSQREAEG